MCLRHGFNHYERTQVFHWCRRHDCPDAVRLRLIQQDNPFGDIDYAAPSCVVNQFMLRLVSCILSHIQNMRRVMDEDESDYGLGVLSCERFLGIGWQAIFLKRFCVQVERGVPSSAAQNLIALDNNRATLMQRSDPVYRQAHPSSVILLPENRDLDLTQVLPIDAEFHMSDVSHTM